MVSGEAEIECPFCRKIGVKAFYKPSYLEHQTSRISAGSKTKYFRVPESYKVMSGCVHCGKSQKDIELVFETGVTREVTHEERLNRLKNAGLPTKVVSSRRSSMPYG